jgi:hypothetical protein
MAWHVNWPLLTLSLTGPVKFDTKAITRLASGGFLASTKVSSSV